MAGFQRKKTELHAFRPRKAIYNGHNQRTMAQHLSSVIWKTALEKKRVLNVSSDLVGVTSTVKYGYNYSI